MFLVAGGSTAINAHVSKMLSMILLGYISELTNSGMQIWQHRLPKAIASKNELGSGINLNQPSFSRI